MVVSRSCQNAISTAELMARPFWKEHAAIILSLQAAPLEAALHSHLDVDLDT